MNQNLQEQSPILQTVDLSQLVGNWTLTGVDYAETRIQHYGNYYEDAQMINFILNGVTYTATEDPSDGYRSMLQEVYISNTPVRNVFKGCKVKGEYIDTSSEDIVRFTDIKTGLVVLEIGTDNNDDYYPSFIAHFSPENMWINAKKLK